MERESELLCLKLCGGLQLEAPVAVLWRAVAAPPAAAPVAAPGAGIAYFARHPPAAAPVVAALRAVAAPPAAHWLLVRVLRCDMHQLPSG